MEPREPLLEVPGPFAIHDMRCAVEPGEHAVYCLNDGIFYPSWRARKNGWHLVQAKSRFQRLVIKLLFRRMT